jgi:cell filamentation protein
VNEDDKYTYPGSGGVLVNTRGLHTSADLDAAVNAYASVALADLAREPMPARPDFEYLRRIHERIFEPIVPGIAGRIRDVDVQATGVGIAYCRPDYILESASSLFGKLEREDYLVGLDEHTFANRLADRWGELSALHPMRDGNTRSQSLYISRIADRAGHPIDWQRVDVDTLRELRLHAIVGREQPLAAYLEDRLMPAAGGTTPSLSQDIGRDRAIRATTLASSDFPMPASATVKQRLSSTDRRVAGRRPPTQDRSTEVER